MQNQQDITKVEFLLTLEGNIIIQRFFNVKDFNPDSKRSMDLYYCVKNICEEISQDLLLKSLEFEYEGLDYISDLDSVENTEEIKKENFLLEIKLNDDVFISRIFPAHVYHPKARYSVDIRPRVKNILAELTNVLSSKELEIMYLGQVL